MIDILIKKIASLKITPNQLTVLGLVISFLAFVELIKGNFYIAFGIILIASFCDLLDGKLARYTNKVNSFGALLDSSLDRYSDALYLGGLLIYFSIQAEPMLVFFALSACVASFEVSYVRARSEGLGVSCQTGFWERPERLGVLLFGLLVNNVSVMVICLGILPHSTAIGRLIASRDKMQGKDLPEEGNKRTQPKYLFYLTLLAIFLIFCRF